MGEVGWGWRKKDDHPPLIPPIKGGGKGRQRPVLNEWEDCKKEKGKKRRKI
jgi:hypothetical protein